MVKAATQSQAALNALRGIESQAWDAFYAVEVLADRIRGHFERLPADRLYQIDEDDGIVTNWCAGQTQDTLKKLLTRFDVVFDANKPVDGRARPTDPIFAALAKLEAASAAVYRECEKEGFDASTDPCMRELRSAAITVGVTVPTTRAGLAALAEKLAADLVKGDSIWHADAARSVSQAIERLVEGGCNV